MYGFTLSLCCVGALDFGGVGITDVMLCRLALTCLVLLVCRCTNEKVMIGAEQNNRDEEAWVKAQRESAQCLHPT